MNKLKETKNKLHQFSDGTVGIVVEDDVFLFREHIKVLPKDFTKIQFAKEELYMASLLDELKKKFKSMGFESR